MTGDERRYRRLLLAYPGRYRRDHGTEIVTTLMEMGEPGGGWDLIAGGVRQRFRLPGRPLVVVAAVLVMLATAVLGAVAGSWAGERTFAPLPSRAAALGLLTAAVSDPGGDDSVPVLRIGDSLLLDGVPVARHPASDPDRIATTVRDGIAASGWTITSFTVAPAYPHPESAQPGTFFSGAYLDAARDGVLVHGRVDYRYDAGRFYLGGFTATAFAARTAAYLPLTVGGGVLGLLAGWLLVAAMAYRLRSSSVGRRRAVAALTGATLVVAAPPVVAVVLRAIQLAIHVDDRRFPVFTLHSALRVSTYVDGPPTWLVPACAVAALLLGALTMLPARQEKLQTAP